MTSKYTAPPDWYAKPRSSTMPMKPRMSGIADDARGVDATGSALSASMSASKRASSPAARSR